MPGWPLTKVISGGQSGADQAGLSAAKFLNYSTGGRAPKGWLTEDGPAPWLAEFGLTEAATTSYKSRTYHNVVQSGATIVFTPEVLLWAGTKAKEKKAAEAKYEAIRIKQAAGLATPAEILDAYGLVEGSGSRYTVELAVAHRKPVLISPLTPEIVRRWIYETKIDVLNIAGSRESKAPGMFAWVRELLLDGLVPF